MLAGIQHHEAFVRCGAITIPVLEKLLVDAGFRTVRRVDQPIPTGVMFLAEK